MSLGSLVDGVAAQDWAQSPKSQRSLAINFVYYLGGMGEVVYAKLTYCAK